MPDMLPYGLLLIALALAGVAIRLMKSPKSAPDSIVKQDWHATGRIDFATQIAVGTKDNGRPRKFTLLVEQCRLVESVAGSENPETRWRLATLAEAKAIVAQHHKYLSENSRAKSVPDDSASADRPMAARPFRLGLALVGLI